MRTEEILFTFKEEQAGTAYLKSEAKILGLDPQIKSPDFSLKGSVMRLYDDGSFRTSQAC